MRSNQRLRMEKIVSTPEKLSACNNCRAAHKGCPKDGPPCGRCIDGGLERSCVYVPKPRSGGKGGAQKKIKSPYRKKPPKCSREKIRVEKGDHHKEHSSSYFGSKTLLHSLPKPDEEIKIISEEFDKELFDLIQYEAEDYAVKPSMDDNSTHKDNLMNKLVLPQAVVRDVKEEDSLELLKSLQTFQMPEEYIAWKDKTIEELDAHIEYDLDSEDEHWLADINKQRGEKGMELLTEDDFEKIIDRLEKESFRLEPQQAPPPPEDIDVENTNCCICEDGTSDDTNQIVFCDGCDIAIHQECYGIRYIPEGRWFCAKCESKEQNVTCVLCPEINGAFKRTTDGRWAHPKCAAWIPETTFKTDPITGMRGEIDNIDKIPVARWKLICELCHVNEGACIQCKEKSCSAAFHVTCASNSKLYMETKERQDHLIHLVACIRHCPKKYRGIIQQEMEKRKKQRRHAYGTRSEPSPTKKKKFLDVFAHETISLTQAENLIQNAPKESVPIVWKYWIEKRKSRSGNPLLKRLWKSILYSPREMEAMTEKKRKKKKKERSMNQAELLECVLQLQELRRDLEKARILLELVKKREITKLKQVTLLRDIFEAEANPMLRSLRTILEFLVREDRYEFFLEDVPKLEYPDYYEIIKDPISFAGIRRKLDDGLYKGDGEFWADIDLMVNNALLYNEPSSLVHKEAKRFSQIKMDILHKIMLSDEEWMMVQEQEAKELDELKQIKKIKKKSLSKQARRALRIEAQIRREEKRMAYLQVQAYKRLMDKEGKQEVMEGAEKMMSIEKSQRGTPKRKLPKDPLFEQIEVIEDSIEPYSPENLFNISTRKKQKIDTGFTGTIFEKALARALEKLRKADHMSIFAEEVPRDDVPDYYDIIKYPMCFRTIQQKLEGSKYKSLQQFKDDLHLMFNNATTYNNPSTIFFKEAKRLLWMSDRICKMIEKGTENSGMECNICSQKFSLDDKQISCATCERTFHTACLSPPLKNLPKGDWFCSECDPSKHCNICMKDNDDPNMLLCDGCDKGYHIYCLKPPLKVIPKGEWFCTDCDPTHLCQVCGRADGEDKMILCDNCDNGYHIYCLEHPLRSIPKGNWFCPSCNNGKEEELEDSPIESEVEEEIKFPVTPTRGLLGACALHRKLHKRCPPNCKNRLEDLRNKNLKNTPVKSFTNGIKNSPREKKVHNAKNQKSSPNKDGQST